MNDRDNSQYNSTYCYVLLASYNGNTRRRKRSYSQQGKQRKSTVFTLLSTSGTFTNARTLTCWHSFCYSCLRTYIEKQQCQGQIVCPVCRLEIDLPHNGVDGFKTCLYLEASTCTADNEEPCGLCDG